MKISIYQVDAFASRVFEGNPAAVCPLGHWLNDDLLQDIAEANNLSETAFMVPAEDNGEKEIQLRWFTPQGEVELCGHATLASAHVLYQHLGFSEPRIRFQTRSGELTVTKTGDGYCLDFPALASAEVGPPTALLAGLGITPRTVLAGSDYLVVLKNEAEVKSLAPDYAAWLNLDLRGVIVTAPGTDVDFVSRCFYPKYRVNEDPVTGSAHCQLAPYWQAQLGRDKLTARQLSPRTGMLTCELKGDRVLLTGRAADYMAGEITL
ncbi:PhzF family phenazine biosynthesis protein [Thalassomonas viridans]|uniref:PhzF family phenazine biosynthesis protein n=1 Tax=Thalassomonas viridans TaxID=137584 RepID=A0AAE9Z569_9GAMM|nr:PhzF family phenazine biosynthesis protein [Thalassomonas viridans]WDE06264.1 PhzF family phenazine biosynthesis protein [Thalassomonas viridans]